MQREAAGQLSHRLLHRGAQVVHIGVADEDRSRLYRHFSFTSTPIRHYAVLTATARKYGLCATASRSVCFGEMSDELRQDHNAVCRVSASYLAASWPDAVPREILLAGRRICNISVNGTIVLMNYDILAKTGAKNKAIAETLSVMANASGQVVVGFTPTKDNCFLAGIEIQ